MAGTTFINNSFFGITLYGGFNFFLFYSMDSFIFQGNTFYNYYWPNIPGKPFFDIEVSNICEPNVGRSAIILFDRNVIRDSSNPNF